MRTIDEIKAERENLNAQLKFIYARLSELAQEQAAVALDDLGTNGFKVGDIVCRLKSRHSPYKIGGFKVVKGRVKAVYYMGAGNTYPGTFDLERIKHYVEPVFNKAGDQTNMEEYNA